MGKESASDGSVEFPTISGAISYDHMISGQVYMLVYSQFIYGAIIPNNFLCLVQIWMAGESINELPNFLAEYPDN